MKKITLTGSWMIPGNHLPSVPQGFVIEHHQNTDCIDVSKTVLFLYFSQNQQKGKTDEAINFYRELKHEHQSIPNATLADHFVSHPQDFPDELKVDENGHTLYTGLWGTIYKNIENGSCMVRFLYWSNNNVCEIQYSFDPEPLVYPETIEELGIHCPALACKLVA